MFATREIISLQIGHFSNYVGTHLWNLQEDSFTYAGGPSAIDHDVLYREGLTRKGEVTFTPRVVLVDLKGSLKHLRIDGDLYDEESSDPSVCGVSWPQDKVVVKAEPSAPKNEFLSDLEKGDSADSGIKNKDYNLEKTAEVWTDFQKTRYHPRSVMVTNQFEHQSVDQPFDTFGYGVEVWKNSVFQEEFTDRIRNFIEECDNAQGFHVTMDMNNGFSGLGCAIAEYLSDEYHNKSTLFVPVIPPEVSEDTEPIQEVIRTINILTTFSHLADNASLIVPMGTDSLAWRSAGPPRIFPHLNYNNRLLYHTSFIIASALDTISLRYRLRSNPCRLSDVVDPMSWLGRRVSCASLALPLPIQPDSYLLDTLESWYGPLWTSLTPRCKSDPDCIEDRVWMQSIVLRGITDNQLKRTNVDPKVMENPVYACKTPHEMLQLFLAFLSHGVASHVVSTDAYLKLGASFPNIFTADITPDGAFDTQQKRSADIRVRQVPAISAIHSSGSVGDMLTSLLTETASYRVSRFSNLANTGIGVQEFKEIREKVNDLADCYKEDLDLL